MGQWRVVAWVCDRLRASRWWWWLWCEGQTSADALSLPSTHHHRQSSLGVRVKHASSPLVTYKMLQDAGEERLRSLPPYDQTQQLMRRIKEAGLELLEADLLRRQLNSHNLLGEGTYGKVYEINLADIPHRLCIKLAKTAKKREYNLRESEMLAALQEVKGVPGLLGVSLLPDAFIMTMHGRTTLCSYLRDRYSRLTEASLLRVLCDLTCVLVCIHQRRLCHNDVKSNNVMVEVTADGNTFVTLIDFGVMTPYGCFPFGRCRRSKYKPFYDPELMKVEKPCSEATDMYSMGYLIKGSLHCFPTLSFALTNCSLKAMGPSALRPTFPELLRMLRDMLSP